MGPSFLSEKTHLQTFFSIFLLSLSLNDQKKDFQSFGPEIYRKDGKQFFAVLTGTQFPLRENPLTNFFLEFLTIFELKLSEKKIFNHLGMKFIRKTEESFWSLNWDPVSSPKKQICKLFFRVSYFFEFK